MRTRIVIAVAAVLAVALGAYLFLPAAPREGSADPRVRVEQLARAKDVDGLSKEVQGPDEHAAKVAVLALGDLGAAARPAVERALEDRRPVVRAAAATTFAKVATREQAAKLSVLVKKDEAPNVRAASVASLDRLFAFQEMDAIIDAMEDPDPAVRRRASRAATKFSGVVVQYNPEASQADCHEGAMHMRQYWEKNRVNITRLLTSYYESHYQQGGVE